jgi:hypothetical protein
MEGSVEREIFPAIDLPPGIPSDARPIPNFSGYFVTPDGAPWTIEAGQATPLKKQRQGKRNWQVTLWDDQGFFRSIKVSVLVLLTFVGPRPRGYMAFHWRGTTGDDRLENLKWATPKEIQDGCRRRTKNIARGEKHSRAKLTDVQVADVRRRLAAGETPTALAAELKVSRSHVGNIGAGRVRKPAATSPAA